MKHGTADWRAELMHLACSSMIRPILWDVAAATIAAAILVLDGPMLDADAGHAWDAALLVHAWA